MTRVPVYVSGQLKQRVIESAERRNCSLTCEVVVYLIRRYRPPNYQDILCDVLSRTAPRNAPPQALNDGGLEPITIYLPDLLRETIANEARRNFRSLSAEIAKALAEEYL